MQPAKVHLKSDAKGRGIATIITPRLCLRPPQPGDRTDFAKMHGDAEVMEFYPGTLSEAESDEKFERICAHHQEHGFGLWSATLEGRFIGIVGLLRPRYEAHFTPCTEIGWRLARPFWGRGYACEATRGCLDHAFQELGVPEVIAVTSVGNQRSRAVMERLNMTCDPADDFVHPLLPSDHQLRFHVLYRLSRSRYLGEP